MYRAAYRNFGDHEAIVLAHTVKPGAGATSTAAVRWYELRATPVGGAFGVFQSGTVQNLLTGEISSEPNEDIQLCISVARSDIELSL